MDAGPMTHWYRKCVPVIWIGYLMGMTVRTGELSLILALRLVRS